ncbi:MAG: pyridoxamine 5'-phosphate oxidase family protein [Spirochaetota bacterium]
MRRFMCEIRDPAEITRLLNTTRIGHCATVDSLGYPYITPVNFVFLQGRVYFHSSPEGEKIENIRRTPRVGFEASIPLAYLDVSFNPDNNPCRAHQLYQSIIIRGSARIISEKKLKTQVLNALLAKHEKDSCFPEVSPRSPGFRNCVVIEITPETITGKSDLGQSHPQKAYRAHIVRRLSERALPEDLLTLEEMKNRNPGSSNTDLSD